MIRLLLAFSLLVAFWSPVLAQQQPGATVPYQVIEADGEGQEGEGSGTSPNPAPQSTAQVQVDQSVGSALIIQRSSFEYWLTGLTIAFGLFLALVLSFMSRKAGVTAEYTRTLIIVVVVFAALFLIAAGYSDKQAAPVYSLLGTIIGYIFGRTTASNNAENGDREGGRENVAPPRSTGAKASADPQGAPAAKVSDTSFPQ